MVEQLLLSVLAPQGEIVNRQLCVRTEIERRQIGSARLLAGARGSKEISNTPPGVELIGYIRVQREIVFGRRLAGGVGG